VITILLAVTFASRYFGSNEYAQPVTVICKVDKAEEVRLLFGRHALMGGWDRSVGTDVIEFTIQPELTPHECEALLERLMDNPAIIKATVKNLD